MKRAGLLVVIIIISILLCPYSVHFPFAQPIPKPIGMAVEFMDHAACAYIARDKGWFEKHGLRVSTYESYVTGICLAAALARGDIQVAYICLVPAINVFANAKVPLKIVAGTHKAGYGLVINPDKIKTIKDLERPFVRIGCVREGGTVDVLLHRTIDHFGLNPSKILKKVQRMNPPKQLLAIRMGQLDAAFLPEQWATMAEDYGFKMLITAQDIWPDMQGSVLVVKEELLTRHPDLVKKLVDVTNQATCWINEHPGEAARVLSRQLSITGQEAFPEKAIKAASKFRISPNVLRRSMARLTYTTSIDPDMVQQVINYMVRLGYIKKGFEARDILELGFLK